MSEQTSTRQTAEPTSGHGEVPQPTVWGTLQAHDAHAMINFLVALGFEATAVYDDPDDTHIVQHAELNWPEGGGVMCGSNRPSSMAIAPGSAGFYVVTADPRSVHDRAVQAGAQITRELNEPPHGGLEFSMRDPEGNQWSFGSYRGQPRLADG